MDLRILALTSLLVAARAAAVGAADRAAAARDSLPGDLPVPPSAAWSDFDVHESGLDFDLDPAALAELDDLALEPVRLNGGDLDRLRAIPWLGREALEAVRQARPIASLGDLENLPGWNAEMLRRVTPFVVLDRAPSAADTPWEAEARSRLLGTRREWRLRAARGEDGLAMRLLVRQDALAGHVQAGGRSWKAVAGDLRLGHAQGLLAWSGVQETSAGSVPLRRARGLAGSDAARALRALRGGGIEIRPRQASLVVAAGRMGETPIRAILAELSPGSRVSLQAGGVLGERAAASLGLQVASRASLLALEVAGRPGAAGGAAALQVSAKSGRIEFRLEATPERYPALLAAVSAADRRRARRLAQVSLTGRRGPLALQCGLMQASRRDSLGDRDEIFQSVLELEWRRQDLQIVCRLRRYLSHHQGIDEEAPVFASRRTRSLSAGVRRALGPNWRAALDYRQAERSEVAPGDTAGGSQAWEARLERGAGKWTAGLSLASFSAPEGTPGLALPELGAGTGGSSAWWAGGDGLRLAGALRWQGRRCDAGLRFSLQWVAGRDVRQAGAAAVVLRYP